MHATRKSKPGHDSVNPSSTNTVTAEQLQAVINFLPIFENMNPDDFPHIIRPPDSTEDIYVVGHLEYHRAVYDFMDACYENGFVQSFDWGAWAKESRRDITP